MFGPQPVINPLHDVIVEQQRAEEVLFGRQVVWQLSRGGDAASWRRAMRRSARIANFSLAHASRLNDTSSRHFATAAARRTRDMRRAILATLARCQAASEVRSDQVRNATDVVRDLHLAATAPSEANSRRRLAA